MSDSHHAAASGYAREQRLSEKFAELGFTLVKTKSECKKANIDYEGNVRIPTSQEYSECGFQYFLTDGYCPELDALIELKGGDKTGTTEEKLFFDLMKITDGCYGDKNLLYIFEGKKQEDKCTRLFVKRINQLHRQGLHLNVQVVMFDCLETELLSHLF